MLGTLRIFWPLFFLTSFLSIICQSFSTSGLRAAGSDVNLSSGFSKIVKPLLPAVVNVSVIKKVTTYSLEMGPGSGRGEIPEDLFRFRDFLDRFEFSPQKRRVPAGAGSGFIIDSKGYVVTNAHVVEGADEVMVTLANQKEFKAKVVGTDPRTDLALLKIQEETPLPYVEFGEAASVEVGDWAIAVGNALGLGGTVTVGIISHVGRSFMMQPSHVGGFFQTDASINLGNSGGPLFNVKGKVIGINMMIASPTGGNIGIGFAIPSDVAIFVIDQLRKYGYVKRGWLGVHIQDINQDIARSLARNNPEGALVGKVVPDAPAYKGGIRQGDLILKIDGTVITNASQTTKIVGKIAIGTTVSVEVWRKNSKTQKYETKTLLVTIGESEESPPSFKDKKKDSTPSKDTMVYGLTLRNLTPQIRQRYGLDKKTKGVLVISANTGIRANEFFMPGDILINIEGQDVESAQQIKKHLDKLKKQKSTALCLVQRQGITFYAALNLSEASSQEKNS